MKKVMQGGRVIECYQDGDLESQIVKDRIKEAKTLWKKRCSEYKSAHGDVGSAVIGAGFTGVVSTAARAQTKATNDPAFSRKRSRVGSLGSVER